MVLNWFPFFAVLLDILSKIVFRLILGEERETFWNVFKTQKQAFIGVLQNRWLLNISHLCRSLFYNKVVGQAWNLIEKETPVQVFSCEFHDIFKNIYFTEQLRTNDSENIYVICRKSSTFTKQVFPNYKMYKMNKMTLKPGKTFF